MGRIVIISPYRDFGVMAKELAEEMNIKVEVHEGWMDYAGDVIRALRGREIDVFISRGGTADYIAHHFHPPVITVNAGLYDILECCEEARKQSRKIVLTSFGKPFVGTRLVEKAMDIEVFELVFTDLAYIDERLRLLAVEGDYCVVGGGPSVQLAKKWGLPSVFLRTSRDTIRDALLRAVEIGQLRRDQKRRSSRLKAILDSTYEGIIAVDASGRIEIFNKGAERLFQLAATNIVGKQVEDVIPNTRLSEVLKSGKMENDQFQDIGVRRIVTNRIPVKDDIEIIGAVATFQDVSHVVKVERKLRQEMTKTQFKAKYRLEDIVGNSAAITETKALARSFANSDFTVLIYGPSGSGKEMFAQGMHNASRRMLKPFVAINCAAIPPTLLESELFGYDEGAFTGAKRKGKMGLFELAHGGTVFLDEIDAMPIELQGRLLRVLQEREVLRVGGETIIPVDIRVIAATNKLPHELVAASKMREDLYYRLNVLYFEVPSLKDRQEDIPLLCRQFLSAEQYEQLKPALTGIMAKLQHYSWPGNVRELQNFCQRLWFYQENDMLNSDITKLIKKIAPNIALDIESDNEDLNSRVDAYETGLIRKAVAETGSIRKAAEKLGVGKSTIARKLKNR